MTECTVDTDILVIGAGPVGMTLALALAEGERRVLMLDSRPRGSHAGDPRALALSHGTRQLLERLGAWNAAAGTAIHDIHVSQRGGFGRTQITREEMAVEALGYVMRYRDLAAALDARLGNGILIDGARLQTLQVDTDMVTAQIHRDGQQLKINARLVVHAEGTPGADPEVTVRDYRQHAVLAEVRPQAAHGHRAWERFTADGPLALLPLGEDYSVVFTVPPEKASLLMSMDDDAFIEALQRQFGRQLRFTNTSARTCYPLALRLRRQLCRPREVWIGNAAQTLHPVSGQGFNLGIRDAWELAQTVLDDAAGDPGQEALLKRHERGRRIDRLGSASFTDGIVRAFSNDLGPLSIARGLGLMALDLCPPARRFVAARMIWGARAWP